jgi:hypothetical protein
MHRNPRRFGLAPSPFTATRRPPPTSARMSHTVAWQFLGRIVHTMVERASVIGDSRVPGGANPVAHGPHEPASKPPRLRINRPQKFCRYPRLAPLRAPLTARTNRPSSELSSSSMNAFQSASVMPIRELKISTQSTSSARETAAERAPGVLP